MFGTKRGYVIAMEYHHSPDVIAIARKAFQWPTKACQLANLPPLMKGLVAVSSGYVVGYAFCEMTHRDRVEVVQVVVNKPWRRHGHGRRLIDAIARASRMAGLRRLVATVDERDLDALKFLRACGWKSLHIKKDFYRDVDEDADAIRMAYEIPSLAECAGLE